MNDRSTRLHAVAQQTPTRPRYEKLTPIGRRRPAVLRFGTVIVIAIVVVGAYALFTTRNRSNTVNVSGPNTENTGQVTQKSPDFTALTPANKNVTWTRFAPPSGSSFYAYSDKLEGVTVRVSEQPLPDDFKDNPGEKVALLARNYNANRTMTVAETTVYIGTSQKGEQSLIFTKESLLVMITADTTLNDKQWTDYIAALQ